jgi:hypothetical protein
MMRRRLVGGLVVLAVAALGIWVARNTYWSEESQSTPMSGAAAEDSLYSLRRLAAALGIEMGSIDLGSTDRAQGLPPPHAALYLDASLPRDLPPGRVHELEAWVQEGGRLVLANAPLLASQELQQWSDITPQHVPRRHAVPKSAGAPTAPAPTAPAPTAPAPTAPAPTAPAPTAPATASPPVGPRCHPYAVQVNGIATDAALRVCGNGFDPRWTTPQVPEWSLSDFGNPIVLRVRIGRGSVTVVGSSYWYTNRMILNDDDARVFVGAADLRRGDVLYRIRSTEAEALLAKLWRLAAPALIFSGVALLFWLWRTAPRFGPLIPTPPPARRSLAEQLRANARFAWRTRRLDALRAAVRRAVDETARRRIPAFDRLDAAARLQALADRSRLPVDAIETALSPAADTRADRQRDAVAALEKLRRALGTPARHRLEFPPSTRTPYER